MNKEEEQKKRLAQLAKILYPTREIEIDEEGVWIVLNEWDTSGLSNHKIISRQFDPENDPKQLFKIMDLFQYITFEHPMGDTWICDYRVDLQDEKLTSVVSDISREDVIIQAAFKANKIHRIVNVGTRGHIDHGGSNE